MTMRKYSKVMSLIIVSVFAFSLAFAQEKAEKKDDGIKKMPDGSYRSKDFDESTRPEDDYLAKFHANEVVEKLMKRNLEDIYLLNVLVKNNSGKGWDSKYQEIYNGYKDGLEQYYKRNMIYSKDKLEKNLTAIRELYKLILEDYQKQDEELLNECAGKVLLLHLDVSSRIDPDKAEQLASNHLRLKVAYGQIDDSRYAAQNKYFSGSIYHLRVSRAYAISILEALAKDENERKSIHDKYKVAKADNMNRLFAEKKEETKTK
jgi:DNA-directed RNA polymerase subunit F